MRFPEYEGRSSHAVAVRAVRIEPSLGIGRILGLAGAVRAWHVEVIPANQSVRPDKEISCAQSQPFGYFPVDFQAGLYGVGKLVPNPVHTARAHTACRRAGAAGVIGLVFSGCNDVFGCIRNLGKTENFVGSKIVLSLATYTT